MKVWDGSEIECKSSLIFNQFFILIPTGPEENDSKRHSSQESKPPSFTLTDTQACIKKHKNAPRFGLNSKLYHFLCPQIHEIIFGKDCIIDALMSAGRGLIIHALTQRSSSRSDLQMNSAMFPEACRFIPVERTTDKV